MRKKAAKKPAVFLKKLDFDPNSQDVWLLAGTPIIARKSCKEKDISNNETFTIKEIRKTKEIIIVADEERQLEITYKEFPFLFNVAYCITCHKSQGSTFDHPYTIHEFDKFDSRMKYVALSRSTKVENINIWS